jgi:hypothetical protein
VKLGDLVRDGHEFWIVTRYDPKRTRTATLRNAAGTAVEVPHDSPMTVVANPGQDWPFVAAPIKPKWGPITRLTWPSPPSSAAEGLVLSLYEHWLPSEPARAGGSIFLNPTLGLRVGDYLLATHGSGKSSSIVIPAHFGTVYQRQAARLAKPKPDRTAYTRLLDDDQFEDE